MSDSMSGAKREKASEYNEQMGYAAIFKLISALSPRYMSTQSHTEVSYRLQIYRPEWCW